MVDELDAVPQGRGDLAAAGGAQRGAITHRFERSINPEGRARIGREGRKDCLNVVPFVGAKWRRGYGVPEGSHGVRAILCRSPLDPLEGEVSGLRCGQQRREQLHFFALDQARIHDLSEQPRGCLGETAAPPGLQHAFDRGLAIRDVLYKNIKPGIPAAEMLKRLEALVGAMPGYARTDFGKPHTADPAITEFLIGSHSTGDWGHGSGPWMGPYVQGLNPMRMAETLEPTNFNSIEFISYTVVPEWQGVRLSLNLEDDAMITAEGVKWLYPPSDRILLIK